jgi:cold shock CspA family protein
LQKEFSVPEFHTGRVFSFDCKRCFGFLVVDGRREDDKLRIFFHQSEVIPDLVGRRVLSPGTKVSFRIKLMEDGKERAQQIESLEIPADPETYFEDSIVESWDATMRSGYLMRPDGSTIYFNGDDVVTVGEDSLRPGRWVNHQVERGRVNGRNTWKAFNISIYEGTERELTIEEYFASAPDLPIDVPETGPSLTPNVVEPSVLAAATRNLPLMEIINRRSVGEYREH